ncbi:MAG: hypothetical protein CMH51_03775 [Myxococcales bacterium]|nr:hypothetical protein [Myxococcales bacterium]
MTIGRGRGRTGSEAEHPDINPKPARTPTRTRVLGDLEGLTQSNIFITKWLAGIFILDTLASKVRIETSTKHML